MNILFLVFHGFSQANGISKKIHYQADALKACGHKVNLCYYHVDERGNRMRMVDNTVLENYGRGMLAKLRKRCCYRSVLEYALQNNIRLVYIRSDHNANPFTIGLVKGLKKKGISVVMEIPTYPYDPEYSKLPFSFKLQLYVDKLFRKQLARHLDRIVTFSDESLIFGTPTIRISNGIDFDRIKIKEGTDIPQDVINLLGVAEVHHWHGFDRLITGLGEYYLTQPDKTVCFHIAGRIDAEDMKLFSGLIQKYGIEKYVFFHGEKYGKELDSLFDTSDFGIGSLARHRVNITSIKTLKNREYAARGIPFIYSETDSDFDGMSYIIKAPADETPVSITEIVNFFTSRTFSPAEIRESIKSLSWQNQMQNVLNSLAEIKKQTVH